MIFPMLAFVVTLAAALLNLFGLVPPNGSIFQVLFSNGTGVEIFKGILTALGNSVDIFGNFLGALSAIGASIAVVAGIITQRDELLYGGLGVLFFKLLGLYSLLGNADPAINLIAVTVVGLFNTIFVISFINWLRGKGE